MDAVPRSRLPKRGPGSAEPQQVARVLDDWLSAEGLTDLRSLAVVRECWRRVVGDEVARHATPTSLRDGALVITVDHGSWATELRFLEKRIRDGLAAQVGEGVVTRLEARVNLSSG